MADSDNPSYYQTGLLRRSQVQHQEHFFHLYAHQQHDINERMIIAPPAKVPHQFGCMAVMDWDVHSGPDTRTGLVGWLEGFGISAGRTTERWYLSGNLVFTDQRFKGSTLSVQGPVGLPNVGDGGDWAVVGGTGEFAYAQGVATYKRIQKINRGTTIMELDIRVVCVVTSQAPDDTDNQDDPDNQGNPNNQGDPDNQGDLDNQGDPDNQGDLDNQGNPDNHGDPDNQGDPGNLGDPDNQGDSNIQDDLNNQGK